MQKKYEPITIRKTLTSIRAILQKVDLRLAGMILIVLPSLLILFHICVFMGLIPQNIVWMGLSKSGSITKILVIPSILINLIIIFCSLVQMQYLKNKTSLFITEKILPFVLWWLVGNTIANLFSKSLFEIYVFTPILVILTVTFYRIKIQDNN